MENRYIVRGVNPATGSTVQSVVFAETSFEAQQQAEAAGLEQVVVLGQAASETCVPSAAAAASLM